VDPLQRDTRKFDEDEILYVCDSDNDLLWLGMQWGFFGVLGIVALLSIFLPGSKSKKQFTKLHNRTKWASLGVRPLLFNTHKHMRTHNQRTHYI